MNVVVCVKQIPDPAVPGSLEADHTLDRSGKLLMTGVPGQPTYTAFNYFPVPIAECLARGFTGSCNP